MLQIFLVFLRLGLTSFGGPVAHLGFFHNEFVVRKKWISEHEYAELVALCQMLPGPASSQIGMSIGYYQGGVMGSLLAWIGFTLPSALLLILFSMTITLFSGTLGSSWLHGLKIAAVAVVAQAVWEMSKKFCTSYGKIIITLFTTSICFYFQNPWIQILLIIFGATVGILFLKSTAAVPHQPRIIKYNFKLSLLFLILFFILLFTLPFAANTLDSIDLKLADAFYRIGALVFGGGHVVLPLIQSSVVDSGWISKELFIAGYGITQALPGPLFSISAYLGFVCNQWKGALVSLIMIFLPSFLLVIGILPYWEKIRSYTKMKTALVGVNAVVVGLLLSALHDPVWTSAIYDWKDFLLAFIAFLFLIFKKAPPYAVVIGLSIFTVALFS